MWTLEQICRRHREIEATDRELLGPILQPKDSNEDYLRDKGTYAWHYAIGLTLKPQRIGEIGVRFGYALACLAGGAINGGMAVGYEPVLYGWDVESYEPGSMRIASANLIQVSRSVTLQAVNTQALTQLACPPLDLIHVDGDHSQRGAKHDMRMAHDALAPDGVMLVDDYYFLPDVQRAVAEWCHDREISYGVLPTFRGTAVIRKGGAL